MTLNRKQLAERIAAGVATVEEMAPVGFDFVAGVKASDTERQYRMHAAPALLKAADDDTRTLSFIASTEAVDRMGDIIRVKGWDLASYRKNPIILFQHNSDWPIGTAKVKKGTLPGGEKALFADITFADAEVSEMAEQVYQLAKAKVLRGNSVGFIAREARRPESDEERAKLGLGAYGVEFIKAELLEDSVVSIPANPEAVQMGLRSLVSKGVLSQPQADVFVHDVLGDQPSDVFDNVRRSMVDMGAVADNLAALADEADSKSADDTDDADNSGDAGEGDAGGVDTGEPQGEQGRSASDGEPGAAPSSAAAAEIRMVVRCPSCEHEHAVDLPELEVEPDEQRAAQSTDPALATVLAGLMATQTEQLAATRQLVDALTDLTQRVHAPDPSTDDVPAGQGADANDDQDTPDLRSVLEAVDGLKSALAAVKRR